MKTSPSPLPKHRSAALAPSGSIVVVVKCLAAEIKGSQVALEYQLDDGDRRQILLPLTAPLPSPGQPVLLFFLADTCQRFTTLPRSAQ